MFTYNHSKKEFKKTDILNHGDIELTEREYLEGIENLISGKNAKLNSENKIVWFENKLYIELDGNNVFLKYSKPENIEDINKILDPDSIQVMPENTEFRKPKFNFNTNKWVEDNPITLQEKKDQVKDKIDLHTSKKFSQGFIFNNKTFSLSKNAQNTLIALQLTAQFGSIVYPVEFNTIDNSEIVEIQPNEVSIFIATAFNKLKENREENTNLKKEVMSKTTLEELDIIESNLTY